MTGIRLGSFGLLCALLGLLGMGCGDDDGGGTTVSSGLPKDQKLSELDEGDLKTACETVADSLADVISDDESKRIDCTAASIAGSVKVVNGKPQADVAKCKELVDECVAMGGPESSGSGDDDPIDTDLGADERDCTTTDDTARQFEDCSATVGEYESCLGAALTEINALFSAINCDTLSDLEMVQERFSGGFEIEALPECQSLAEKCPEIDLAGGDDEESSEF